MMIGKIWLTGSPFRSRILLPPKTITRVSHWRAAAELFIAQHHYDRYEHQHHPHEHQHYDDRYEQQHHLHFIVEHL